MMNDAEHKSLVPSLAEAIQSAGLDAGRISLAVPGGHGTAGRKPRNAVLIMADDRAAEWNVPSLRELFRGNNLPPNLDRQPELYDEYFNFIERHVVMYFQAINALTDQQMEEIYSNMARRPDGRSLGPEHDYVWQIAALLVGTREISAAQFEAIFRRLARSARTFGFRPVSRNYAESLASVFGL